MDKAVVPHGHDRAESGAPQAPKAPREKPNYQPSGKLLEEVNTVNGVVLKYVEPMDAKRPTLRWRLHVWKGGQQVEVLPIHTKSSFLIGRERRVVDIPTDHPSCSQQHAVIQFRRTGTFPEVTPYLLDLESANGTMLNGSLIPPARFVSLRPEDLIQFGYSTREYILLHEEYVRK